MKKLAAILLIAILFFNWYGYRIVTGILARDADRLLEAQLDNNKYDEAALIEIRIPLNVPYQNEQADFERHYGEMEIDGNIYTYVKRKIEGGFLVLKCIPNNSKEKIREVNNDFFKLANGLAQDQSGKKQNNSNFAKNFWSEYDGRETEFTLDVYSELINRHYVDNNTSLYNVCRNTPTQPPEGSGPQFS